MASWSFGKLGRPLSWPKVDLNFFLFYITDNFTSLCQRSIIILDNWSVHRSIEAQLQNALNAKGAMLLWNPPNSPDLNPIEKMWDLVISASVCMQTCLMLGQAGVPRQFTLADFQICVQQARMSIVNGVVKVLEDKYNEEE